MNGFLRETDGLIARTTDGVSYQYKNVYSARALGTEGSLTWTSPGSWVVLDGNATWQDVRNTSEEGEFAAFAGDRIPNRPWLFANWSGRLQWRGVLTPTDELSPFYFGRNVHDFFRSWESIGDPEFKAVTYMTRGPISCSTTFEVDNLFDEKLFDFFGVQRPGRSVSLKVTGEL